MIRWEEQSLRSLLFAPGIDERKLAKVGGFGSDAIVLDLEDAVANDLKIAARATTRAAVPTYGDGTVVIVRVNDVTTGSLDGDIAAVVCEGLDAIMVPKVEDAATLVHVDEQIAAAEAAAGLEQGSIRVIPLVETPLGLARCESFLIGAPKRVHTAAFGGGDFTAALGIDLSVDGVEVLYARSRLIVAANAAGMARPIDGPWLRLQDPAGLEADSVHSRALGFQGRINVYPPQVEVTQRAYSVLDDDEVTKLRRIIEAFEESEATGVASIRVDGTFVDYPIYRVARERILRYDAWRASLA